MTATTKRGYEKFWRKKERSREQWVQNRTAMHPKCRSPLRTRYAPSTSRVWTPTMCFEKQLSFLIEEIFIQPLKFNKKFLWWANGIFFTVTWVSLSCCLKHSLPVIMRLQTNGLKYLVVTFCIVYDLQKMLGCASFTLEMQIKISIILHRGQQSNKGFPNKHNSTYIVTLTVTFVSNLIIVFAT